MHVYCDTDPLQQVMLGTWFLPEYFDSVKNARIREPLKQIAHETHEDLENFAFQLRLHGVEVYRPVTPTGLFDSENIVRPVINVRDTMRIIGTTMYKFVSRSPEYGTALESCIGSFVDLTDILAKANQDAKLLPKYSKEKYELLCGSDWPIFEDYCANTYTIDNSIQTEIDSYKTSIEYESLNTPEAPCIFVTDQEIIVDHHEYVNFTQVLSEHIKTDKIWRSINTHAGHTDGCFNLINPTTIIGIGELIDRCVPEYRNQIRVTWDNFQGHVKEFNEHKKRVNGRWWIPGQENNDELTTFIEHYLGHLVGHVEETQFDLNVLCLDHNTTFVTGNSKDIRKLKDYNIDAIPIQWRHRWFHDGGLHCITLDLLRR